MPATLAFSRPIISSPLANSTPQGPVSERSAAKKNISFQKSRAISPFPTLSTQKIVKVIEPPKNFVPVPSVLHLTQAEFSRRDSHIYSYDAYNPWQDEI